MLSATPLPPWSIHQWTWVDIREDEGFMWPSRWRLGQKMQPYIILRSASKMILQVPQCRVTSFCMQHFVAYYIPAYGCMWKDQRFLCVSDRPSGDKTVSITCPDVNPDCEASRKLAVVWCWHFLVTAFFNSFAQEWDGGCRDLQGIVFPSLGVEKLLIFQGAW